MGVGRGVEAMFICSCKSLKTHTSLRSKRFRKVFRTFEAFSENLTETLATQAKPTPNF